jgi:hypothetical protein
MSAARAALKKIQAALAPACPGCEERKKDVTVSHGPWPEPGPLPRAAKTWGCRLPKLDLVAEAYKKHQDDSGKHEVDPSLSTKLAGDLARPFGQSTGRGFSFTRFRIHHGYRTLVMRQQDGFAPWIGPNRTVLLRTLYEIGRLVTYADPICGHLRWGEEYPFLVPNLANLSFYQRFSEDETRRITAFSLPITAFSLPITALDNKVASLMAGETGNIHPRLRCALLHKTGCVCRDSIAFGSLYVLPAPSPNATCLRHDLGDPVHVAIPTTPSTWCLIPLQVGPRDGF